MSDKTSTAVKLDKNRNVQIYLTQHRLTTVLNPSDDSDFQDTTYETDLEYEREKKLRKQFEEEKLLKINKIRENNAKLYFEKNINKPNSIFNQPGIEFNYYTHIFIRFIFTPSVIDEQFICSHRRYHVSLKYRNKWWCLKRYHVPNRDEVINIFKQYVVLDNNLIFILYKIYECLCKGTLEQVNTRKEKYKKFLNNEEVELNSDDEKLFLTSEELKKRKDRIREVWARMLPPN